MAKKKDCKRLQLFLVKAALSESLWSAATRFGDRLWWQSQRQALKLGVVVALSEAAQFLGTYVVMTWDGDISESSVVLFPFWVQSWI